jgi:hypothetical protein
MTAAELMSAPARTVTEEISIVEAARLMATSRFVVLRTSRREASTTAEAVKQPAGQTTALST